jgi:hypothetical protein
MIRPAKHRKVVLVQSRRGASSKSGAVPIRRYRLATLRLDSRSTAEPRYQY